MQNLHARLNAISLRSLLFWFSDDRWQITAFFSVFNLNRQLLYSALYFSVSPVVIALLWVLLNKWHEGFRIWCLLPSIYSWTFILYLSVSPQKPLSPQAADYPDELLTISQGIKTLLTKVENQMCYSKLCLTGAVVSLHCLSRPWSGDILNLLSFGTGTSLTMPSTHEAWPLLSSVILLEGISHNEKCELRAVCCDNGLFSGLLAYVAASFGPVLMLNSRCVTLSLDDHKS